MNKSIFGVKQGQEIAMYTWETGNPKGVVQISHGMAEHSERYDDFAKFLNSHGYIVVSVDHLGHGATGEGSLGYSDGDMWNGNLTTQLVLSDFLADKYKLPLFLFGHSYGSFLAQGYMQHYNAAKAVVLSGSCMMKGFETVAGGMVSSLGKFFKGKRAKANMVFNMSFKAYDKKHGGKGKWLSSDQNEVDKYNADGRCGYVCSTSFYKSMFKGLKGLYSKNALNMIDKDEPILLMSGSEDPVGKNGKGVEKLFELYKKIGVKDVAMKLYPNGRHEMLNEINRQEVYNDVLAFFEKNL